MGDRANLAIKTDENDVGIWLYTHWGGDNLAFDLQNALKFGSNRWGDDSYLTRIIVCQIIGDKWNEETGYGISHEEQDNEHHIIYVNLKNQEVSFNGMTWTFMQYLNLTKKELIKAYAN
jgi:hypothetical protein